MSHSVFLVSSQLTADTGKTPFPNILVSNRSQPIPTINTGHHVVPFIHTFIHLVTEAGEPTRDLA